MRESFTSRHKHIKLMSCFSYHRVESLLWRGSGWKGHFFRGGFKKSWKNHEIMEIHGKIMETPTQNQLFSLPNPIPNQDTIDFAKFVGSPAGSGKKGEEVTPVWNQLIVHKKIPYLLWEFLSEQLDFPPCTSSKLIVGPFAGGSSAFLCLENLTKPLEEKCWVLCYL